MTYCNEKYHSMQGDLNKNYNHVRGLDRPRQTESEETPMESTRQSDEPARSNLLGGADEPIGASPPLLSARTEPLLTTSGSESRGRRRRDHRETVGER